MLNYTNQAPIMQASLLTQAALFIVLNLSKFLVRYHIATIILSTRL